MCKLGANCHGAEVIAYFLKGYCQGRIYKNLSKKKGLNNKKKTVPTLGLASWVCIWASMGCAQVELSAV